MIIDQSTSFLNNFLQGTNSLPPTGEEEQSNASGVAEIAPDCHGDVAHVHVFGVLNDVTATAPNQPGIQPHGLHRLTCPPITILSIMTMTRSVSPSQTDQTQATQDQNLN